MEQLFVEATRAVGPAWPFQEGINIYSDGSHGMLNERIRACLGRVAFMSSEATNQMDPSFPGAGKVDRKEYADIRKLLEAATGGRYRWSTATEERARMKTELDRQCSASSEHGRVVAPSGASSNAQARANRRVDATIFDQPIDFASTNINICLIDATVQRFP